MVCPVMLAIGIWVIGRYLGSAIGVNLGSNGLIEAQWYLFDLIFLLGRGGPCNRMDMFVLMCSRAAGLNDDASGRSCGEYSFSCCHLPLA